MTITVASCYQKACLAGFNSGEAVTMTAICIAESGLNATALNDNPKTGDLSYGLSQINMIGALGPARRVEFGLHNNIELFEPDTNLRCAHRIYVRARNRFTDWSTYTSGRYAVYLRSVNDSITVRPFTLTRALQLVFPYMHGTDVCKCQTIVGTTVDGIFGPLTRSHVMAWQHDHRLVADGIVGPRTAQAFGWGYAL
jgi:peptidoglycan hydrolase-like protein with peptidoglycan-binding domain